jgi:hypothetical protein
MKITTIVLMGLLVLASGSFFQADLQGIQIPGSIEANTALGKSRDNRPQQPGLDPDGTPMQKESAAQNGKEIKVKVERLYQLATELKTEMDATDMSKVLPTTVVKKAQDIEKLAKEIKTRAKG